VDAGRLHRARVADLLQPVTSPVLAAAIPVHLRDREGYWYGLSLRTRPIMYALDRVSPADLSTYEALAGAQWKGRICMRSSGNIYNQSLVASMITVHGAQWTEEWVKKLVSNFARPPHGGDRDQIKGAAAGECDVAVANNYYLARMLYAGKDDAERAAARKVAIFWPNQNGRGTHVNVSGAGVTRAAPNRANAIKLLEFLVSDESQRWYAEVNYEYPVKPGISPSAALNGFGAFKADSLSLQSLGENNIPAVEIMDRAGWK